MLILSRRVGEALLIGDEITITVLGVKGNQVRIGIQAPRNVTVLREELVPEPRSARFQTKELEFADDQG